MKKTTLTLAAAALIAVAATPSFAGDCASSKAQTSGQSDIRTASFVSQAADMNIVETAIAAGNFTTLVAAIQAAGLVEALSGEGPFTVFAPTDAAFAALPAGTVEGLLADKEKLTAVLTYHVVPGIVMAEEVVELNKAETLQGESVKIKVKKGVVTIDDATVVTTDIMTSNGVIHVIDAVLLPKMNKDKK